MYKEQNKLFRNKKMSYISLSTVVHEMTVKVAMLKKPVGNKDEQHTMNKLFNTASYILELDMSDFIYSTKT